MQKGNKHKFILWSNASSCCLCSSGHYENSFHHCFYYYYCLSYRLINLCQQYVYSFHWQNEHWSWRSLETVRTEMSEVNGTTRVVESVSSTRATFKCVGLKPPWQFIYFILPLFRSIHHKLISALLFCQPFRYCKKTNRDIEGHEWPVRELLRCLSH